MRWMQRWDSLPSIRSDELCLSLLLYNAEANRMFFMEPMASCTHPLLLVSYLVLNNSVQTQQNQEQGWSKYFLTLFMRDDTGLFPLLPENPARQSSAGICDKNAPKSSSIPTRRTCHLVDKLAVKRCWDSIMPHVP